MINLHNKNSIGKKLTLGMCLFAFLSCNIAPLAASPSYESGVESNVDKTTVEENVAPIEKAPDRNVVLKGEISLAKGEQKIAVSLRDSDVKQVLRMFADKAGLNIVFHKSVEGKITLDLVNVTLNKAFNMVMEIAELTYVIDDETLMVASSSAAKELNFTKESMNAIPVKYIDASRVATFLNKNIFTQARPGLSNSEIVVANPRENEILIFGSKSDFQIAKKVIEEVDKPLRITTFKVNHTTPKEMAKIICDTWLDDDEESDSEDEEDDEDSEDGDIVVGGGTIACTLGEEDEEEETEGGMASLKTQKLKIAYFTSQGLVKLYGGTAQQAEDMKKFVSDADKKQPQALIEMSIVELNETGSKTINNEWTVYSRFFSGTLGGAAGIANTNPFYPVIWHSPSDTLVFKDPITQQVTNIYSKWRGPAFISTNINWVIQQGNGRTLANPKIMVTNGKESVIDLTSDYVASVTTQYLDNASQSGSAQVQKTYNIANDKGIKVSMTPFISPDGYVSINIKPEYATKGGDITNGTEQDGILLQRRSLELKNLRIKDGETMIIGGLIQQNDSKTTYKAPFLGDLPLIGWLFRSSNTSKDKSEMIIMITPHIIRDAEDLVELPEVDSL